MQKIIIATKQVGTLFILLFAVLNTPSVKAQNQLGDPVRITPQLMLEADITGDFKISSDSTHVVYRADQITDGFFELFSLSVESGNVVRLNSGGVNFGAFKISHDGTYVVYQSAQNTDGISELFSVPITGGSPVRLNLPIEVGSRGVSSIFQISSDSTRVVYLSSRIQFGSLELFSVPIEGGTVVRLNPDLPNMSNVFPSVQISSDSTRVIYVADQNIRNVHELFSVPITGGNAVRLNPELVDEGDVSFTSFNISPDGNRVVYTADQITNGIHELFSVPITGGNVVRLNPDLQLNIGIGGVNEFQITPDSTRVVFSAPFNTNIELLSVPIIGGSDSVSLTQIASRALNGPSFRISPDGDHVVFQGRMDGDGALDLFSVPIIGGEAVSLNLNLVNRGSLFNFQISPDSTHVIYEADRVTDGIDELFSVPILGGITERVNDDLFISSDINTFQLSPDGRFIIYNSDQEIPFVDELFLVSITQQSETFCMPIRALNGRVAMICL